MNRLLLLIAASLAVASAAPLEEAAAGSTPAPVAILRSSADGPNPDGSYNWAYEAENGIKAEEHGELKAAQLRSADNEDGQAISAQGGYSYTAPDGSLIEVKYVADENGFQPQGAHIPVAPAIPEAIQRALAWIAAHPQKPEQEDKQ